MKGGKSIEVLLDLALGNDAAIAQQAAEVLKTQVFLYEADTNRLKEAYNSGNAIAKEILESYAKAEFFTNFLKLLKKLKWLLISLVKETFLPIYFLRVIRHTQDQTVNCTVNV
jgi:aconitase B